MNSSWGSVVNATLSSNAISAPVDPFSGPLNTIEPWNFKLLATLMFFVTFLSLSENFTVLLVTYKYKQLRQPLNYIILNLSLADFLVSVIGGTLSFITNLYGYFVLGPWACVLEGFAVTFFGIVALWSLAVLAFERYFVICRPLGNIRLQGKHAALGIVFIWVFSFIWTIPPTIGWSSYTVSPIGTTCEPNWYSGEFNDHTYIIAFFTTCFIMPLLVIFVSYGKLIRKLRKVSDTQGRLGVARKPEKQVTRMVIVMILAFLFCWSPYAAFSIIVTACPAIELDPRLAAIPAFFSKTATVYNPVIYVFMNRKFRKCVLQMFSLSEPDTNPTAENPMQGGNKNEREMSTIARMKTSYVNTTKHEECSKRDTFPQLPIPENEVCPV
ncbi:vertebrate ancient long opsin a [Pristis pectinata]|uniref:vertebrate ancient long opsin a n=1 Tax=Pristis pectinata TaxID=685728 RepID=UPI00223E7488|nr:vertebrate ancient long opsin a [Pristis pectinata]